MNHHPNGRRRTARFFGRLLPAIVLATAGVVFVPASASADDVTVSVNNLRTGWDQNEAGLSPSSVSASDFGQLFSTAVGGQVYAQPVIGGGTLIAATDDNNVYGINPVSGAVNWTKNLGAPWPSSTVSCGDLTPNIGATATPVYDSSTGTVYLTSKANDGANATVPHWYMHALSASTGAERSGWPVTIAGTPSNSPGNPFNPETAMQRPGLLLLDGVVYAGFGSHCDHGPYVGYVVGVKTSTAAITAMWSTEAGSSTGGAGIWQAGGGLVSDGSGRIILATGNGGSPAPGPGGTVPSRLAESVVRLQVATSGTLSGADYFSPANNTGLDANDTDLGSGGPMAIPDGFGSTAHPHLLVQVGKDGRLFLLDRDHLGGTAQGPNGTDAVVSQAGPYNGVWGHPAFWGGDGGYVYTVENGGFVRASKISQNSSGVPTLVSAGTSSDAFGYTSGSPVVSSSGSTSGTALVWVVKSPGSTGAGAQLRAYDAVPQSNVLHLRYSVSIGTASKFAVPATDNGRVYVGTRDGHILAFGRPSTSALTGSPVDFGSVAVGSTGNATLNLTATRTVTVTGAATTAPFGETFSGPRTLAAGGTLAIPVTFTPTAAGSASASVNLSTDAGTISFDLNGTGTRNGLAANPTSLAFGTIPTGANKTLSVDVVNTGTSTATITGSTAPTAPFSAGMPSNGTTIAAGGSLALSVTYAPTTAATNDSSALSIVADTGSVTVPVTGTAVSGSGHLSLNPNPLAFNAVLIGTQTVNSFTISNTGNTNLTITKAAPPAGVFTTDSPISEGQQITPGENIGQPVNFAPTSPGVASSSYLLTSNDGQGALPENLTGIGALVDNFIANGRCMNLNNSATANGTPVQAGICNGTAAQNWRFGANNSLIALGKCLTVKGGGTSNGTVVEIDSCTGSAAQQWQLSTAGALRNPTSGRCLTVGALVTGNKRLLAINDCNGATSQTWLSAARTGPIVGSISGRCLTVASSTPPDGTTVQLNDCAGASTQSWTTARGGTVTALGKCLYVQNSAKTDGTPVQLSTCDASLGQQWVLTAPGVLTNPNSGRCLAAAGKGTQNGTPMQILACTGAADQVWLLH